MVGARVAYVFSWDFFSVATFDFLAGVGYTLFDVASSSVLQESVGQETIARISNLMGVGPKVATILALPAGGALVPVIGIQGVFLTAAMFAVLAGGWYLYSNRRGGSAGQGLEEGSQAAQHG